MIHVSYIIPAKNEIKNIRCCICSIKENGRCDGGFEIIVVDNGSTDGTQVMASDSGATVLDGSGLSISGLRNFGAKHAEGEIFAFIDADIVLLPGWCDGVLSALSNCDVGLIGSSPELPNNPTWVERTWYLKTSCMPQVWERPWLASMNMAVRREVFIEIGGFNANLVTCEDVDFGLRLGGKYRILNDKSIRAIHLGNAKTLKEFYLKEKWRATSNYKGLFEHGFVLSELPSLLWPLISFLSAVIFFLSFITASVELFFVSASLFLFIPFIKSFIISLRLRKIKHFFSLLLIWSIYSYSRLASLISSLFKLDNYLNFRRP